MGKVADVLASTLAYTTVADAPVNYRFIMYVPQRLKSSHGPDGKIADVIASTLACITLICGGRTGQLQYIYVRAAET